MTTHRRAVLRNLAVIAALAAGTLVGLASPAYAADVTVNASGGGILNPGGSITISASVKNEGTASVTAKLTFNSGDVSALCSGICDVGAGKTATVKWTVREVSNPTTVVPGQSKDVQGTIAADDGSDTVTVKINGVAATAPTQGQTVTEVSGTVKDSQTGAAIEGANVMVLDSASKKHLATSDKSGKFKVSPTATDPIIPGSLVIGASKTGFATKTQTVDGRAGQAVTNVSLKLAPSSSASASTPEEAVPEDSGSADPGGDASDAPKNPGKNTSADDGMSVVSMVLIVLGAMLVLFPVVVIFMLWKKRDKDEPEDEEGDEEPQGPRGPRPPAPGARGMYHQDPDGRASDATMISHDPGGMADPGNMNDATAIVHTPLVPPQDPYGQSEYDQQGYGPRPGYGSGPGYGAGYSDGPGAGYGQRNDEYADPTSIAPVGGYDAPTGRGGPAGGYGGAYGDARTPEQGRHGGYDDVPTTRGGYDDPAAYGETPRGGRGGYDDVPTTRGGYDDPAPTTRGGPSYGPPPSGYDDPAAYGETPRGGRGGYDDGYPDGSGRPPASGRGGQRPVEWLDD